MDYNQDDQMSEAEFIDSIRTALVNIGNFSGKLTRKEERIQVNEQVRRLERRIVYLHKSQ